MLYYKHFKNEEKSTSMIVLLNEYKELKLILNTNTYFLSFSKYFLADDRFFVFFNEVDTAVAASFSVTFMTFWTTTRITL